MTVLYTAAHGGFGREAVPLGGGAAVFEHLVEEWERTKPFELKTITPAILGRTAPRGSDLVAFSEQDYATFSRAFEKVSTEEILRHDPANTVVLVNDVSEGPDFATLAARGFRIFTIYHVDVVAYISAIYLHGWISPEATVRWYKRLGPLLPSITQLVWKKQEASVRYSQGLIVPSAGMREVLLRCYPECPSKKIHILPWGSWSNGAAGVSLRVADAQEEPAGSRQRLRNEFGIPADAHVLLTLSRISPEKGQDLLLDALLKEERRTPPKNPRWLFICGDAAFMQGRKFLDKLKQKAARLRHTHVIFPGYVTGERKQAVFDMADLYVFPSRHESYGLTLLEALSAGLPAVCVDHLGARSVMKDDFGALVKPNELATSITRLLDDPELRARMSTAAREFASTERFSDRATALAYLLGGWASARAEL